MIVYRCKHTVEAMRWDGASRELLTSWHEKKTDKAPWFREAGVVVAFMGDEWHELKPGEWLLWMDEFVAMEHELFVADYEAVP